MGIEPDDFSTTPDHSLFVNLFYWTGALERLTNARLIVTGEERGEPYVEPAHDFLVKGWPKLNEWLNEQQQDLLLQRRLTPAALEWKKKEQSSLSGKTEPVWSWFDKKIDRAGDWFNKGKKNAQERLREKKAQFLWNGNPYLDVLRKTFKSRDYWFNQVESEFVQQSVWQRRRNINLRWGLVALAFLTLSSFTFAIYIQLQLTELRQKAATVKNLLLGPEPLNGLLVAIQATGQSQSILQPLLKPAFDQVQSSLAEATEVARERNILKGHKSEVTSVVSSPNGQMIVSGHKDGTVHLWNINGELIHQWSGHQSGVTSLALSPNAQKIVIASGGNDGTLRLWDINGKPIHQWSGHNGAVTSVAFSPNMQKIVSGGADGIVRLWDINGNSKLLIKHQYDMKVVRFDYLGKRIPSSHVAVSADGQKIFSAHNDGTVRLWDINGKLIRQFLMNHKDGFYSIAFSPDGQKIVSGNSGRVRLWDINGKPPREWRGHENGVESIAFSPDGQMIVSGGGDSMVRLWSINCGVAGNCEPISELRGSNGVGSVAFSPDGRMIVGGNGDGTVQLWDTSRMSIGQALVGDEGVVKSIAFSPNGQMIVSGSDRDTVWLWDINGKLIRQWGGHKNEMNYISSVVFSPNEQKIVTGSWDGTVQLWDINGKLISTLGKHESRVSSVAFSSDGQKIFSGDGGMVRLWDINGKPPDKIEIKNGYSVAFSPDKQMIVSGNNDGTVQLWNIKGKLIRQLGKHEGERSVSSVAFSPNGQMIVSSSGGDMRLWHINGKPIGNSLRRNEGSWSSVAFSPDSQKIVSNGSDNTLRLWDINGNLIGELRHYEGGVQSVAFSPNGRMIASGSWGGTVRLWRVSWQGWLDVSCNSLRYHPVFTKPEEIENPEQRHLAIEAFKTCKKYVWNKADSSTK